MSETSCKGCEFWGDCTSALSGFMGWGSPWGHIENGTEKRPTCRTWQERDAKREANAEGKSC